MLSRKDFRPYQHAGHHWAFTKPKCALFFDMGLGKTVTTLTVIRDLINTFQTTKVLIVAPKLVAETVWHTEARQWQHTRDLTFSIAVGDQAARISAINRNAQITVINVDALPWLVDQWPAGAWPYDMVVIDESSMFKSHKEQTPMNKYTRFGAMVSRLHCIERLILLSGTPAPNSLIELWPQIYMLDQGERLGKTIEQYRGRYFELDRSGYKYKIRNEMPDLIHELVSDLCMSLDSADFIDLPECIYQNINVGMGTKAAEKYKELKKEYLLELEGLDDPDAAVVADTAAILTNKLLQFANGAIYYDEEKNYEIFHDAKIKALKELVEASAGQPILVAYQYQSDLERLKKAFPKARVFSESKSVGKLVDRWNQRKIDMLLVHPASAGHGLNLQKGGNIAVWFSLTWSLEQYLQFNKRLHRSGQAQRVTIYHIVATGTIDHSILERLETKEANQKALLDYLKMELGK
jgi:SNF2 family DNA or RNA helicase